MITEVDNAVAHWILFGCESSYKTALESGISQRELGAICFAAREILIDYRQYSDVAFEFGVSEWQLRRWIRAIKRSVPHDSAGTADELAKLKAELAGLRKEHERLKEENRRLLEEIPGARSSGVQL